MLHLFFEVIVLEIERVLAKTTLFQIQFCILYMAEMCHLYFRLNNTDNKKKNLFAALKKGERDKKKLIDTVLKQLRGLVNGTASI